MPDLQSSAPVQPARSGLGDAVSESVSGIAGSLIALLATYPLKTIYTLQALDQSSSGAQVHRATGIIETLHKYKLSGLYVGIEPNIVETCLSSGVYFGLYSRLRDLAVRHQQAKKQQQAQKLQDTAVDGTAQQQNGQEQPAVHSSANINTATRATSSRDHDIGFLASLLVPAVAAIGNQLVTMPASVVATRMQALKKANMEGRSTQPANVSSIIRAVYQESGLGGFWAGLLPSLVLISNPTIQYMLYEQLLKLIKAWKRRRLAIKQHKQAAHQQAAAIADAIVAQNGSAMPDIPECSQESGTCEPPVKAPVHIEPQRVTCSALELFFASALSKVGATIATYWLIVVKSRMQAAGKELPPEMRYTGTLDALRRIWLEEGAGGFFKGLKAKVLQTALNAALMLMLKEQMYQLLRRVLTSNSLRRGVRQLLTT